MSKVQVEIEAPNFVLNDFDGKEVYLNSFDAHVKNLQGRHSRESWSLPLRRD